MGTDTPPLSEITGTFVRRDPFERDFVLVDTAVTPMLYERAKRFWSNRNTVDIDEAGRRQIIADQNGAYDDKPATVDLLGTIAVNAIKTRRSFSMLELGAANGQLLDLLYSRLPNLLMRYVGWELLPLLAEDFRRRYPRHEIIVGDAEAFVGYNGEAYDDKPFSLFFSCLALKMIAPPLVRDIILKATDLADEMLIFDYVGPETEEIPAGKHMIITFGSITWFLHPWRELMAEAGFEITAMAPELPTGFGYLHARRREPWTGD